MITKEKTLVKNARGPSVKLSEDRSKTSAVISMASEIDVGDAVGWMAMMMLDKAADACAESRLPLSISALTAERAEDSVTLFAMTDGIVGVAAGTGAGAGAAMAARKRPHAMAADSMEDIMAGDDGDNDNDN